ncbi:hypothetical protein QYE76_041042 [Lolium multiflorum]|uniref:Uncharacterized protein n=1 Tax=Lolium multiflorum TaxID=4521 RepID=A0AAD8WTS1_LOLMU|nr:hypothetical protein QYE76_041042 [Lolium multiflorum]
MAMKSPPGDDSPLRQVPEAISESPEMGFAAAASREGFPYRGLDRGFATEALSRRKGRSRAARGPHTPGRRGPPGRALGVRRSSPHFVILSVFWKLRAKIGPRALISSNSENISLLGFLKPKTAENSNWFFGILLIETQEPIASSSAAPVVLGKGCDLSSLLTFDPEFIEPSTKASAEPGPSATHGQLQHLKALLSSSIETLVEDTKEIKSILEDIQPHRIWPVVTLSAYKSRVTLARQIIGLRHAQLPLRADIADKCQWLNEKKAALDAKVDTSVSTAELEVLRKELEDLEERVRVTKQLIQDKEALIARSHEEAEGLKAELKTDLAEIRALNKQLVTGQDEDDEAEIAEVDRVRASALRALEAFLQ